MDNREELCAGIGEMRSVARRLLEWADRMEVMTQGGRDPSQAQDDTAEEKALTQPEARSVSGTDDGGDKNDG